MEDENLKCSAPVEPEPEGADVLDAAALTTPHYRISIDKDKERVQKDITSIKERTSFGSSDETTLGRVIIISDNADEGTANAADEEDGSRSVLEKEPDDEAEQVVLWEFNDEEAENDAEKEVKKRCALHYGLQTSPSIAHLDTEAQKWEMPPEASNVVDEYYQRLVGTMTPSNPSHISDETLGKTSGIATSKLDEIVRSEQDTLLAEGKTLSISTKNSEEEKTSDTSEYRQAWQILDDGLFFDENGYRSTNVADEYYHILNGKKKEQDIMDPGIVWSKGTEQNRQDEKEPVSYLLTCEEPSSVNQEGMHISSVSPISSESSDDNSSSSWGRGLKNLLSEVTSPGEHELTSDGITNVENDTPPVEYEFPLCLGISSEVSTEETFSQLLNNVEKEWQEFLDYDIYKDLSQNPDLLYDFNNIIRYLSAAKNVEYDKLINSRDKNNLEKQEIYRVVGLSENVRTNSKTKSSDKIYEKKR